jgi:hypothetical protein
MIAKAVVERVSQFEAHEGNPGSPEDEDDDPAWCSSSQVVTPEAAAMLVKRPSADNGPPPSHDGPLDGSLAARGIR